ncbi:hypothetical protein Tco_0934317 [Tanacetum coccineum]
MKRSSSSTSNSQNLAFLSSENTSSTNEVSITSGNFRVNTAGGTNSSSQIDQDDLENGYRMAGGHFTVDAEIPIRRQKNANQEGTKGKDLMVIMAGGMQQQINHHYKHCSSSSSDNEGEKYEFQNYELKCREIKINNLKMELEKVVKERDEMKVKIEKLEESSKGLNKLLNSQMSAKDKNGLGYGTQLDEMSNKSETDSEISMSVFEVRSSDEEITLANDRFSKADGYHVVPPPIIGNFLTPRSDISFAGLDEYAIRKKFTESKTTKLNTNTSKSKTSETVGKTNEVNIEKPKSVHESVVPKPKINRDKVIIKDWNLDDEDDVFEGNLEICLQDHAVVDSGCSSHMTVNKPYLSDYEDYNGGFVAFGSDPKGDVLKCNLFSASQMCNKKNSVLFTDSECLILSPSFKLLDENQVVLRAPRQNGVYSLDLKNIVPSGGMVM